MYHIILEHIVLPCCSLTFHGVPWIPWYLNLFIQFHNITMMSPYYILLGESSFHFKSCLSLYWGISSDNSVWLCVFCCILLRMCVCWLVCACFHIHVRIDCQYIYHSDMLHPHCFRHVLSGRLIKRGLWHAESRRLYQQPESHYRSPHICPSILNH